MAGYNDVSNLRVPDSGFTVNTGRSRGVASGKVAPVQLLVVVAALLVYGLVVVWSAVQGNPDFSFKKQLFGVALGIVAMMVFQFFDYRRLAGMVPLLLIINAVLILSPHLPYIGVEAKGARSWINVGMQIQPGEFAKITVILLDAAVISRYEGRLDSLKEYVKCLCIIAVPFVLIMTQPDLGTGTVYLIIGIFCLVMGGARWRYLIGTLLVGVSLIAAVLIIDQVSFASTGSYLILDDYQHGRINTFLDPTADSSGDSYNFNQALIAIGSGGLFGKGLGNATQSSLGFLPEAPTDFIFCVLAEQFGFVGALVLIVLYVLLVVNAIKISKASGDMFGTLIVMGILGMWLFHIFENIGMDIGLMPITGIPLPFMSYGSSFMLVNLSLVGLICSVYTHR